MSKQLFNLTTQNGPDETDPCEIEWSVRQGRAQVAFEVEAGGLPINPVEPNLPEGRNGLWHWGEAVAADAIVSVVDSAGRRSVLMVERSDGHGWALPGGMLDFGETAQAAVARELAEETGLELVEGEFVMLAGRYAPDPRAGRAAWMVTIPGATTIFADVPPAVEGRDDARQAAWIPADSYADMVEELDGQVFAAHVDMLREQLN